MKRVPLLLAGCLLLVAVESSAAEPNADNAKLSKPHHYSGYSFPEYKSLVTSSQYVGISDGTKLAVDVYRPREGPRRTAFPVILMYTPYQRSKINPETAQVFDLTDGVAKFVTSFGYVLVCADMRGTGASTGWLMDFMPEIWEDGKELIDWIAEQPWCDGNVGMSGASYLGWSQTATASRKPAALKCIMPTVIPLEGYTGEIYPGGIYLQGFLKLWSGFMYHDQRNEFNPKKGYYPTKPVVDEDGDGELADEIPLDTNGNGTFVDDGFPPTYRDGKPRKHVYYNATMEHHRRNYDYATWAAKQLFIDAASPLGYSMFDLGPNAHVRGMMESGVPIYNVGGWFDGFARGSVELYCTLKDTNPSKLIMAPSYHGSASGPFFAYLGQDAQEMSQGVLLEHLRFFDRYLKGIDNGIDKEPPIYLFVMNGDGWRFEHEWPLSRQVLTRYHFDAGNRLAADRKHDGTDAYKADFRHDSSYGDNKGNRWLGIGGKSPNTVPMRTEKDRQCLVYTSDPFDEDIEVTGHPIVRFWVSSTADYGDFFVYLEDVDEQGEAILVTEAQLRAGFAALHDNNEIVPASGRKIDVRPKLPWHGYKTDQYVEGILAGGKVVDLLIDFQPTAWVFKKGHRLRVSIACADYPTYRLHPKLSPKNSPDDPANTVPTITVHRGAKYPSHVELPVIPRP